jgi:3-oxoacyl-[acyl-carrier protein] reductase
VRSQLEFRDKIVLVTGSGNGIGRSIALAFAREEAKVIIVDIDEEAAVKVGEEVKKLGMIHLVVQADVSNQEDVKRIFLQIIDTFGSLDILINNVGTTIRKPGIEFSEEEWDFVIDTNIKSTFLCSKEAGKIMLKKKSGSVLNISSIHGLGGISRRLPYSAAKSAVDSLTKTLACEWAADGVRMNAIAPGYILTTGLQETFDQGLLNPEDMLRRTPQGRLGTPEEIAEVALFLSSAKASFITGAVLYVDGGYAAYHGPEQFPSMPHNL